MNTHPATLTTPTGMDSATARRLADALDADLLRVADGTWDAAKFVDSMADFVTMLRRHADVAQVPTDPWATARESAARIAGDGMSASARAAEDRHEAALAAAAADDHERDWQTR